MLFVIFSVGQFRIISHYNAALFTARRDEMYSIVKVTFRYLVDRPQVHSDICGLPFMVILIHTVTLVYVYYLDS